jgi:hypothetical protein
MTLENGELTFMHGQITQACWNNRSGKEALKLLNLWGACRFTFTPTLTTTDTLTGPLTSPSTQVPRDTKPQMHALPNTQGIPRTDLSQSTGAHQAIDPSAPQRTIAGDKALRLLDQAGLSRSHLRLFLLVDGKRTINELTRLVGKKNEDVHKLLQDLENTGLIFKDRP